MFDAELIERAELQDLHAAATPELKTALKLHCEEIGSALVSVAGSLPASAIVINRAMGLGLPNAETEASVARIVSTFVDRNIERFFIQRHPAARPAQLPEWLADQGLVKARSWQKFSRGRQPVPETATDLEIREIGPEHATAFGRIACDAFDLGEQAIPWLALLPGRPGWRVFMSFAGDQPAGVGALFIQGDYAWTDFGATAPAFRQRGSQSALLAARIQCAIDEGCREIFTCTGEDVEGDPQHSYKNIKKLGFTETYVRENYAPPRQ